MADFPKIPLADRLRQARQGQDTYFHLYRLYVDTYFNYLDLLFDGDGTTYGDAYEVILAPYLEPYKTPPLLTRFVADSRGLSDSDRTELLFQTLILPFAELQQEKERMEKECMSLPF